MLLFGRRFEDIKGVAFLWKWRREEEEGREESARATKEGKPPWSL